MLECLADLLRNAILEFVKQWLRDWGYLLLTFVIAMATVVQGIFAMRVYRLQQSIEKSRLEPRLFCRVKGEAFGGAIKTLEAQLSNLSTYSVWIQEMIVVLNGPVAKPEMRLKIDDVLDASETKLWVIARIPFNEIIPVGSAPAKFKVQVKFDYSTSSVIGVQISPVYDVTVAASLVTSLELENESGTS